MFAYRMGRASNFVEAFHPLSPGELGLLQKYHQYWYQNMAASFDDLDLDETGTHVTSAEQLGGEHAWAYRLAVERSVSSRSYFTPAIVDACGTRNPYTYGSLSLATLDNAHVQLAKYKKLLERVMEHSPSLSPVLALLDKSDQLVKAARKGRDEQNSMINGAVGQSNKERRSKVIFKLDDADRHFTQTDGRVPSVHGHENTTVDGSDCETLPRLQIPGH